MKPEVRRLHRIQTMERAGCEITTTTTANGVCVVQVRESTGRTFHVTHRSQFDFDTAYQTWMDRQVWFRTQARARTATNATGALSLRERLKRRASAA